MKCLRECPCDKCWNGIPQKICINYSCSCHDQPQKDEEKGKIRKYDRFVRQARAAGFIDDQINFLWDWIMENQDY